jgi:hypothetical protein
VCLERISRQSARTTGSTPPSQKVVEAALAGTFADAVAGTVASNRYSTTTVTIIRG